MQLARPASDRLDHGQGIGEPPVLASAGQGLVFQFPVERVDHDRPAVALVADVLEGHGERGRNAVLVHVLERPEQGRAVGEAGLGEEVSHLDAGIDARAQAPRQFQDDGVPERAHRMCVLAGRHAAHFERFGQIQGTELFGYAEPERAADRRQGRVRSHGVQQNARKRFAMDRVEGDARPRAAPDLAEDIGQDRTVLTQAFLAPGQFHRNEVTLRASIRQGHIAQKEKEALAVLARDLAEPFGRRAGDLGVFRREPSLPRDIGRQHLVDDPVDPRGVAALAFHHLPAVGENEGLELGQGFGLLLGERGH